MVAPAEPGDEGVAGLEGDCSLGLEGLWGVVSGGWSSLRLFGGGVEVGVGEGVACGEGVGEADFSGCF